MGDFLCGLCEHEAASRVGAVEAAAREIVEQGFVIELGIVAAEREFEAVLALGSTVTLARSAAHFVEDGRHVAQKRDFGRLGSRGGRGEEEAPSANTGKKYARKRALAGSSPPHQSR